MKLETRVIRLEDARPVGVSAEVLIDALLDETMSFEISEAMLRRTSDRELNRAIDRAKAMVEEENS